ncbi:MAG TPA: sigma-70 family RNA polymerase sigma factor [Vicinamibacterales bacterium]|jgi:RNA polymerase sigma factor (TIGR02999 family)
MSEDREDVTRLLARWADGDAAALDRLMPIVYAELRKIADAYLRRERGSHTLQPTALVNEAWLRLVRQDGLRFDHRKQFYALAAQAMRRILVDHARALAADKRGGGVPHTTLEADVSAGANRTIELIALDEALEQLSRVRPRQAQVIELRYFGGLTVEEVGELVGASPATVSREQKTAEAWLGHVMSEPPT